MRAVVLLLALSGWACAPEDEPPPRAADVPPPPGVVLRVDGIELTAAEVEPLARTIAELYPEYAPVHTRRLALTNELLTRVALRAVDPEGWAAARAACAAAEPDALEPRRVEGGFRSVGLPLWSAARELPQGEWSAPVELAGRWVRVRLDARGEIHDPRGERLELALLEFPFIPPEEARERMEAALDAVRLTIVDPAWEEAIPESWKHRMRGQSP